MTYSPDAEFAELIGKRITSVDGLSVGSEEVTITCEDGSVYRMVHHQDCCESVKVEDIAGDVSDLVGLVVDARQESNSDNPPEKDYIDCFTWTFYIVQTDKGAVTIRWLGESNGYYSEKAYFERIKEPA